MKKYIKNQIARFAKENGLSLGQLATILGVNPRTLQKWAKVDHYPELMRRALNDLERDIKAGKLGKLLEEVPCQQYGQPKTKLERIRKEKGLTLQGLAEKVGRTKQCIYQQERVGIKDFDLAATYAVELEVAPERLLEDIKYDSKFATVVGPNPDTRKLADALNVELHVIHGYLTRGILKRAEARRVSAVLFCKLKEVWEGAEK